MFDSLGHTPSLFIDVITTSCAESGASRHTVTAERRNPTGYSVYVGHPISGIRVGRILEMQNLIVRTFAELNRGSAQEVHCLFPMRTTHLTSADVGDNEYSGAKALFSDTRHFTLQNRMDAIMASDAVLVNFDLRDDDGNYRISKGIPFDYGWAGSCGRPVAVAIPKGNPNDCLALDRVASRNSSIEDAVASLNSILRHTPKSLTKRVVAEVFDFTGAGAALSMIAALARADAEKHRDGGRAIISVIPEGRAAACWHGQIAQVSDWVVEDIPTAADIVKQLVAA
ncbi:hypothetical protein GOB57_22345 [Sinorhizobium meliloti]|nr:hypothetical protein [Sinorhizobium meliloti]